MTSRTEPGVRVRLLFLLSVLLLLPAPASAAPNDVFDTSWTADSHSDAPLAVEGRVKGIRMKTGLMNRARVRFELFDGEIVWATRSKAVGHGKDVTTWVGTVDDVEGSHVAITLGEGGAVAGSVSFGDSLYEIVTVESGAVLLFEVDQGALPPEAPLPEVDRSAYDEGPADENPPTANATWNADLLVVYSAASRARYGQAGIESMITNAVAGANASYANSNIDMTVTLVHQEEIAYQETGDMSVALERLQRTSDGFMDSVHALRDQHGADMVALVNEDANYCGIAYVMQNESSSFDAWAFSVTYSGCLSNETLAHEIGHNMGNAHDRDTGGTGTYSFSHGYRRCVTDGSGFRTVMAYSCNGGTRIQHFSNPDILHLGNPTGIDDGVDPANSADNARSMDLNADTIATWRPPAVTTPPTAPSGLTAVATGYSTIDLSWTDNSGDETGFSIERSPDEITFVEIATVAANISTFEDTGLADDTTYWYRVSASNGAGTSAWSNTAFDTTFALPAPPATPTGLTVTTASGSELDLAWTDVADEDQYEIERSASASGPWAYVDGTAADVTTWTNVGLGPAETWHYRVIASNAGGSSAPSASASGTTDSLVYAWPDGESFGYGSVSGSWPDTTSDDGVVQVLTEEETGGKPSRRTSRAQHTWLFTVPSGTSAMLLANAWRSGSGSDDFDFEVSIDGGSTWSTLFTVSSGSDTNVDSALLPAGASGAVLVRATDSDRTRGERVLDALSVDELVIEVDTDPNATPPAAPSDATASVVSATEVDVTWTDNATDEAGFDIQRDGGSGFVTLASVGADVTEYNDATAAGDTTYTYRVCAYSGAGDSAWAVSNAVTTPPNPGGAITATASGYKIKGRHATDLSWSGATGDNVEIHRDGALLVTTANEGFYTDATTNKGGRTYVYEVCEVGGAICSAPMTVVF